MGDNKNEEKRRRANRRTETKSRQIIGLCKLEKGNLEKYWPKLGIIRQILEVNVGNEIEKILKKGQWEGNIDIEIDEIWKWDIDIKHWAN